ncbi:hypothetical protein AA313_de0208419 [Arthrobotrys entomopaga]|nr:hypothetical protein AA313_de0208419 [Arthrobotrys entomopaga]
MSIDPKRVFQLETEELGFEHNDDYDDANAREMSKMFWTYFRNGIFTDVTVTVFARENASQITIKSHRLILSRMILFRDKLMSGESTIEIHGVDPKCFLHLLGYAYTNCFSMLQFPEVILPENPITSFHSIVARRIDRSTIVQDHSNDEDEILIKPLEDKPPVSVEEKVFLAQMCVTARTLGFNDALTKIENLFINDGWLCLCIDHFEEFSKCPLYVLNFDQETLLEYCKIIFRNFGIQNDVYQHVLNRLSFLCLERDTMPEIIQQLLDYEYHEAVTELMKRFHRTARRLATSQSTSTQPSLS